MKIFLMNDDYNTVVVARDREQAVAYFRSLHTCDDSLSYDPGELDHSCTVREEVNPNRSAVFEELGEKTFGEMIKDIPESNIPTVLCWTDQLHIYNMVRVGKKKTRRSLYDREWNEIPSQ